MGEYAGAGINKGRSWDHGRPFPFFGSIKNRVVVILSEEGLARAPQRGKPESKDPGPFSVHCRSGFRSVPAPLPVQHRERLRLGLDLLGLCLDNILARLPERSRLLEVHPGLKIGLLQEVTPAGEAIFYALFTLELRNFRLGFAPSSDDRHDAARLIGQPVIADDGKAYRGFVPH